MCINFHSDINHDFSDLELRPSSPSTQWHSSPSPSEYSLYNPFQTGTEQKHIFYISIKTFSKPEPQQNCNCKQCQSSLWSTASSRRGPWTIFIEYNHQQHKQIFIIKKVPQGVAKKWVLVNWTFADWISFLLLAACLWKLFFIVSY